MKSKRKILLLGLIVGFFMIIFCLIGKELRIFETYKALFGIMLGVGSGLMGGSLGQLINDYLIEKDPSLKKKKEIEVNDERNIYINNKAKSKAFNVMSYVFPLVIFIEILLEVKFIITIILLIAYLFIYIVYIYFLNKYLRDM